MSARISWSHCYTWPIVFLLHIIEEGDVQLDQGALCLDESISPAQDVKLPASVASMFSWVLMFNTFPSKLTASFNNYQISPKENFTLLNLLLNAI